MAGTHITGFRLQRGAREEVLCLETTGGGVYLRQGAVEAAGDSWLRTKHRARVQAVKHGLPFVDETRSSGT